MGHGTHWAAALENFDEDFSPAIELAAQRGKLVGRRIVKRWAGPFGTGDAEVFLLRGEQPDIDAFAVVVSVQSKNYLHSAFPIVRSNAEPRKVKVVSVHERAFGLEACITADLDNAQITFFEPYYAISQSEYQVGSTVSVRLGALATNVSVPASGQTVRHPEIGKVSLDGAAILFPFGDQEAAAQTEGFGLAYVTEQQDRGDVDDYQFRGPIKVVSSGQFLGRPLIRATATVKRPDDEADFDLDILFLRSRLTGTLAVGSDLSGVLWLQGTVT